MEIQSENLEQVKEEFKDLKGRAKAAKRAMRQSKADKAEKNSKFAATLSQLRRERGISQKKAAGDLGISQALLSHYENGAREPGLAFVCRACDYYGVSADFLLGRAPSPTCTPEQLEALRVLVQDVRTAADRAEAALEEIAL